MTMVTFAQLRGASFDSLGHAGDTWTGLSGHLEHLATQVRSGMLNPLTGRTGGPYAQPTGARPWSGAAANEAVREIGFLSDELEAFHYEALAVSAALHRAGKAFADAKQKLTRAIGDAEGLDATVASDGTVTLPGLSPADRNDPEAVAYHRRKWDEVQGHVKVMTAAVAAATEADAAVAKALRALDPDEVDPTKHADGVRNARSDLEAAAGMPTDPKELKAWWAALDPAVRAGLLASDPSKLVKAGVLGPTDYEWSAADAGAGPWKVREPGQAEQNTRLMALALIAGGEFVGNSDAAANMTHYLAGSGTPLSVDVDRMLNDDATFRQAANVQLAANKAQWRQAALDAFEKSGGAPVSIPVESPVAHRTFQDRNWYLAVGSHAYLTSGVVTAVPGPDGRPQVSLQYQVNVWDRYNWDPGKSTPIAGTSVTDADMAGLHRTGLAKEYDITGRTGPVTVPLEEGGAPVAGPGTGGGRHDSRVETRGQGQ
ncbi:hypothetical protein ACIBCA_28135 [Kitasatospora sp. NPDC051170]|uniref:hypothetical protein n=1 Tax=Kitasatospora sp. NPDC051170 TaxID=3364056 RepID=UPI00378737E9